LNNGSIQDEQENNELEAWMQQEEEEKRNKYEFLRKKQE